MDNSQTMQFKVKLGEVDLIAFRDYMIHESKLQDLGEETTYLEVDFTEIFGFETIQDITPDAIEEDPEEFQRILDEYTEITMRRYEVVLSQLKSLAPNDIIRRQLDNMSVEEISHLKQDLQLDETEEMGSNIKFVLPGCNDLQIEHLREYLGELDSKHEAEEVYKVSSQIERLEKHELILLDVSDAAFAAFVKASTIEQSIPQRDEEAYLAAEGVDLKEYFNNRKSHLSNHTTVKEKRERLERDKMLRRYAKSGDREFWKELANILTLFLIPPGESFSVTYANARVEYIEKMTMDQLYPILSFIEAVLIGYGSNTAISGPTAIGVPRIESSMKSLRSKGLTFLASGAGLSS